MKKIILILTVFAVIFGTSGKLAINNISKNEDKIEISIKLKEDSISEKYNENEHGEFNNFLLLDETNSKRDILKENQKELVKTLEKRIKSFEFVSSNTIMSNCIYANVDKKDISKIRDNKIDSVEISNKFTYLSSKDNFNAKNIQNEVGDNGIYSFTETEYTGEGMLVGIIDTGIDVEHDAFSSLPEGKVKCTGKDYFTNEMLGNLNAKGSKDQFYKTQKVVYAYDYEGKDYDVRNVEYGSHGYHVAGIACGNNGNDFYGASPSSQLAIFKVFEDGAQTGATQSAIIDAIEDAIVIGCDVINMSLGSVVNYTENNVYEEVIDKARDLGIAVVVANGNSEASTKFGSKNYSSPDMMDYATAGSPASTSGAFGVGNSYKTLDKMNESSSWGCLPNMEIKPDISAPGTMVKSAVFNGKPNEYGYATGTSMASPNVAGIMANMLQYINDNKDIFGKFTKSEKLKVAEYMLMSTSVPIYIDEDEAFVSPRHQGSGIASLNRAVHSNCYLTDIKGERPKVSIGEDPIRTGIYEFSFMIHNLSNKTINYALSGFTSTDKIEEGKLLFMPSSLESEINFSINGKNVETLEVASFETKVIDVQIILNDEEKDRIDNDFKNGTYIDGRVFLESNDNTLNLPFIVYYGAYEEANAFSSIGTGSPKIYIGKENEELGKVGLYNNKYNPYDFETKEEIDYLKNQDDSKNYISSDSLIKKLEFRILRQLSDLKIQFVNLDNGKVYESFDNMGPSYQKWNLENAVNEKEYYQTLDVEFKPSKYEDVENGSRLGVKFEGKLPYFNNKGVFYILPFNIDDEAPLVNEISIKDNKLSFVGLDNGLLQCYNILYKNGKDTEYMFENNIPTFSLYKGERFSINNLDLSSFLNGKDPNGKYYIELIDFAGNKNLTEIKDVVLNKSLNLKENLPTFNLPKYNSSIENGIDFEDGNGGLYMSLKDGYILKEYNGKDKTYKVLEGTLSILNCSSLSLENIILPSTLKSIGHNAFKECLNLKEVTFLSIYAPIIKEDSFNKNINIKVPFYNAGYNSPNYISTFKNGMVENCVVFDSLGGSFVGIQIGKDIKVENPKKKGYDFIGWYDVLGQKVDEIKAENQLLKAKYISIKGQVEFNLDGQKLNKMYQVGQKIMMPYGINKPYNVLVGWNINGESIGLDKDVFYDGTPLVIEGIYVKKDYNFNFIDGDKKVSIIWKDGDELYTPSKKGFEFKGWYLDEELKEEFKINPNMKEDISLYAKWEELPKKSGCGSIIFTNSIILLSSLSILVLFNLKKKEEKR